MRAFCFLAVVILAAACGTESSSSPLQLGPAAEVDIVVGDSQRAPVHTTLATAIRIRVSDQARQVIPQQVVNFVVTKGGGSVFGGAVLTDGSGEALEQWTLGDSAGEQRLEARAIDQDTGEPIVYATVIAFADPGPAVAQGFAVDTLVVAADAIVVLPRRAFDQYGNATNPGQVSAVNTWPVLEDSTMRASDLGFGRFALGGDTLVVVAVVPSVTLDFQMFNGVGLDPEAPLSQVTVRATLTPNNAVQANCSAVPGFGQMTQAYTATTLTILSPSGRPGPIDTLPLPPNPRFGCLRMVETFSGLEAGFTMDSLRLFGAPAQWAAIGTAYAGRDEETFVFERRIGGIPPDSVRLTPR